MAIPTLPPEQIRTWTREQKDRWWLENVYRGDMPQLTFRSAIVGFFLGGILSATNLYVGAKTGWTLGVGLTSVILGFAMFKVLSGLGIKDMTILENNAMQSIATAAGYMTGPLISGIIVSVNTRSGRVRSIAASPALPSQAVVTSWPSSAIIAWSSSATANSSSTTSTSPMRSSRSGGGLPAPSGTTHVQACSPKCQEHQLRELSRTAADAPTATSNLCYGAWNSR